MSNKNQFVRLLELKLNENGESIQRQWRNPEDTNTRHFVLDGLLPEESCKSIYNAFPRDGNGFFNRESFREKKRTSANLDAYDPILSDITYAFQHDTVVRLISEFGFKD